MFRGYARPIIGSPQVSLYDHVLSVIVVSTVRFVTDGAIDPKFSTYVPLGPVNAQTKFRSSLMLVLPTMGPKPKTQEVQ
jgi:hypothetical protein